MPDIPFAPHMQATRDDDDEVEDIRSFRSETTAVIYY